MRRRALLLFAMATILASSAFNNSSRRLMFRISRNYAAATHRKNLPYHHDIFRHASPSSADCLPMLFSSLSFEMTANEIQMRDDALKMINASIRAVDPYAAVKRKMKMCKEGDSLETLVVTVDDDGAEQIKYDMSKYDRIRVFSVGKASAAMALAAGEVLSSSSGKKLDGVTIIKDDHATSEEIQSLKEKYNIIVRPASHPVPDARSVSGSNEILQLAKASDSRTLIVACISGGGSALFCSPREPLTLEDLMQTNSALLASGMPIEKMNVIRKRLENGKGGRLAATAFPATVLTLVLSDIIGDPIDLIASGPTVPDASGWDDACRLVTEYGLEADGEYALPDTVLNLLRLGKEGHLEDTPKSSHPAFRDSPPLCQTVLVGNNKAAVVAAANEADRLGWNPVILGTRFDGEASIVAGTYVAMAEMLSGQREEHGVNRFQIAKLPAAIIAGGETVVTIPAGCNGKGGRNQELALSAAIKLKEIGLRDVVVASCGTDGTDGPTDAAGAIVDGGSVDRIEQTNTCRSAHDALKNHDAYNFFHDANSLIETGPTGTNVADVMITLVK